MLRFLSRMSFSKLSPILLQFYFKCLTYLGLLGFGVQKKDVVSYGLLVTYDRSWLKWYGILMRVLGCFAFGYIFPEFIWTMKNLLGVTLGWFRFFSSLLSIIITMWKQIRDEDRILSTVNAFFKLFWRVQSVSRRSSSVYGGEFEFIILLTMLMCLIYDICAIILFVSVKPSFSATVYLTFSLYLNLAGNTITRICSIGYLSVNVLYTDFNNYVRYEFCEQMRNLEESDRRDKVKIAAKQLDKCIDLYEDIQRTATKFHKLLELPLFLTMIYGMSSITHVSCKLILNPFPVWYKVIGGLVVKHIIDLIILSFAVDKAVASSRLIRNLIFENEFLWEHRELVIRMEMFFGRLHLRQFRVRILGLFDISNRFILFCLSAIVTHVTIILQLKLAENTKKG